MQGIYVILLELDGAADIAAGRRRFALTAGHYAYVGSALSGLEPRLSRHLRREKRFHWHIDFLLERARISRIIGAETAARKECDLARRLARRLPAVAGFGSSDCKCASHLFFGRDHAAIETLVTSAISSLGLRPFTYHA